MSDPRPTRAEMAELGRAIQRALLPLLEAHPTLVYAMAYGLPREGPEQALAAATSTNITDARQVVTLLVHNAREMQDRIDQFYVAPKE